MSLCLQLESGLARIARATYRGSELALRYAITPSPAIGAGHDVQASIDAGLGIRAPKWLAIADTLVLEFVGSDADFIALDAYTNSDLWKRSPALSIPEVVGTGRLRLATPPQGTDRIDLGVVPSYEYSESEMHLRITLGRPGIRHYRVSTCLVVGVDEEGIATLHLSDLHLEG